MTLGYDCHRSSLVPPTKPYVNTGSHERGAFRKVLSTGPSYDRASKYTLPQERHGPHTLSFSVALIYRPPRIWSSRLYSKHEVWYLVY